MLLADAEVERAEDILAMIKGESGGASVFQVDVTCANDRRRVVKATANRYSRLDILDKGIR